MFEIDLTELVPKALRDAKALLAGFPVSVFLGENPVSSTLIIPGTADKTGKRLSTLKYPDDRKAVRRACMLYDAWLSFYRGALGTSQETAQRLFEEIGKNETGFSVTGKAEEPPAYAQKLGAAYLICSLARYGAARHLTDAALAYMKELKNSGLRTAQAAEIDLAMYEMSVGIMFDVPTWIIDGDLGVGRVGDKLLFSDDGVYPENIYAAMIAAIQYKNYHGEYLKSLALIDMAENSFSMRSVVIGDVYFSMYRALNEEALGFYDEADKHLKQAVKLVKKDALWQIISQFAASFGERLYGILEETDAVGTARCKELSEGFFDRVKDSHMEEKELRSFRELSNQERLVLQLSEKHRKISEIAAEMHIEPVTVNYHKTNALEKLGIGSRDDIGEALKRHETRAVWIE